MSSPVSLIDRLRVSTRALHEDVERRVAPDGPWTAAQYARLLRMSHAVIAPIEGSLAAALGDLFSAPPPATRAARLETDLAALGYQPAPPRAVHIRSHAEAFGAAYVLQGSLLGGALIVRQARASLGASVPTSYLELYGPALSQAWRRFCAAANAFGSTGSLDDHAAAVDAALRTFAAHGAAFDSVA